MNDFTELELELKKLRPARPSAGLTARIERALAEPAPFGSKRRELPTGDPIAATWKMVAQFLKPLSLGLGLAAALLLLARVDQKPAEKNQHQIVSAVPRSSRSMPIPILPNYQPSGLTQVVYDQRNEGLVYPVGQPEPVRCVRTAKMETLRWQDPRTGSSIRVSYPLEEVTLSPVSFQ